MGSEMCIRDRSLPWWSDWIWPAIGTEGLVSWQGAAIKLLVSVAVVLPPAIPMGMTLPLFTSALVQQRSSISREGIWLYGTNTAGGVLGLLLTSNVLLERFGIVLSMEIAILINIVVAACAFSIHHRLKDLPETDAPKSAPKRKSRRERKREQAQAAAELPPTLSQLLTIAFASGLAMLSLEILAIQLVGLVVPSSLQATVSVLGAVILLLAVAALVVPLMLQIFPSPKKWLVVMLAGASLFASLAPAFVYSQSRGLIDVSHVAAMDEVHLATTTEFTLAVFSLALATIGPALLLGGMVCLLYTSPSPRDS